MNYDNFRDQIEYTIKAFGACKCCLQEQVDTDLIKLEEDIHEGLILKLNFAYLKEEVGYINVEMWDPVHGYDGFQSGNGYFSLMVHYGDFIYNEDISYIDINKVIEWFDGRVLFLKDLMFFDEDSAVDYYWKLCEMKECLWELIKANSQVYQMNLKAYERACKLRCINDKQKVSD